MPVCYDVVPPLFDSSFNMETKNQRCVYKAALFMLHNLRNFQKCLDQEIAENLVRAFLTSKITPAVSYTNI